MILNSLVKMLQHVLWEIVAVVELTQIIDEFRARHFSSDILAVQVGVEEHDGTRQRVNGVLGVQRTRVTVEEAFREVNQHALSFLRLARQRKLLEEQSQRLVQ